MLFRWEALSSVCCKGRIASVLFSIYLSPPMLSICQSLWRKHRKAAFPFSFSSEAPGACDEAQLNPPPTPPSLSLLLSSCPLLYPFTLHSQSELFSSISPACFHLIAFPPSLHLSLSLSLFLSLSPEACWQLPSSTIHSVGRLGVCRPGRDHG